MTADAAAGLPTIDGVPLVHVDQPGSTTVLLTFGVGLLEETGATFGVTHLIEHLAMSTVPRSHLQMNASVHNDITVFTATGRPEQVAGFLAQVCAALSDLPLGRIPKESRVLEAEEQANGGSGSAPLWAFTLGIRGPGLGLVSADFSLLTPEVVRGFAARHFTAGNAALGVVGPLPPELRLQLPTGDPPPMPELPVTRRPGPVVVDVVAAGVALTFVHPTHSLPVHTGITLLSQRLEDRLRHELGTSYGVEVEAMQHAGGSLTAVVMDAREGEEPEAARIVWQTLTDLAERGPTPEELAWTAERARHEADLPEAEADGVLWRLRAITRRQPWTTDEQDVAEHEALTVDQVRDAMAAVLPSAAIFVIAPPEGIETVFGGAPGTPTPVFYCEAGEPLAGTTYRAAGFGRLVSRTLRRVRLVVGDDGVSWLDPDGDRHTVTWEQVLRLERDDDDADQLLLLGMNRCAIPVGHGLFGKAAEDDVRRRLAQRRPDLRIP